VLVLVLVLLLQDLDFTELGYGEDRFLESRFWQVERCVAGWMGVVCFWGFGGCGRGAWVVESEVGWGPGFMCFGGSMRGVDGWGD